MEELKVILQVYYSLYTYFAYIIVICRYSLYELMYAGPTAEKLNCIHKYKKKHKHILFSPC